MARVVWSPRAADDLEGICDYIAKDSPQYARIVAGPIGSGTGYLVEQRNDLPRRKAKTLRSG